MAKINCITCFLCVSGTPATEYTNNDNHGPLFDRDSQMFTKLWDESQSDWCGTFLLYFFSDIGYHPRSKRPLFFQEVIAAFLWHGNFLYDIAATEKLGLYIAETVYV